MSEKMMRKKINFKWSRLFNIDVAKSTILIAFHRFVKQGYYDINWGNNQDIKHIGDLIYG